MKSVCQVYRNPHAAARFTGTVWRWVCETPSGTTYCGTREEARDVAREYNAERRALLRGGERQKGHANFYND